MKSLGLYLSGVGFVAISLYFYFEPQSLAFLKNTMTGMDATSYAAYVGLLVIAVVLMPVTVMPLIPVAAGILGPLPTALLSIVGWTVGAVIAFSLARYLGRPLLTRFVSLKSVDDFVAEIPGTTKVWFIALLRMTTPVDIGSYALGLTKSVSFFDYVVGTFIGVIWFSFAFAYLGDFLMKGNWSLIVELGCLSLFVFFAALYLLKRKGR